MVNDLRVAPGPHASAWSKCPHRMLSSSGVPLGCPRSTLARSKASRGSLGTGSALRGPLTPERRQRPCRA